MVCNEQLHKILFSNWPNSFWQEDYSMFFLHKVYIKQWTRGGAKFWPQVIIWIFSVQHHTRDICVKLFTNSASSFWQFFLMKKLYKLAQVNTHSYGPFLLAVSSCSDAIVFSGFSHGVVLKMYIQIIYSILHKAWHTGLRCSVWTNMFFFSFSPKPWWTM